MNSKAARLLLSAALLCAPAAAFALEGAEGHGPCKADFDKFCKDVQPGEGRIIRCMKEHEGDFSPECKVHLAAKKKDLHAHKGAWDKACGADVAALCKDVKPGEGRIIECLKENKEKVSQGCKDFIADKKEAFKEREHGPMQACLSDKEKFCKDVEAGGGRIIKCLHEHSTELSDECKKAFSHKAHRKEKHGKAGDKDSDNDSDEKED